LPNENQIGPYRLARDGITLSRIGEDGRVCTSKKGDMVYISGRKAKEIGAEKVEEWIEEEDKEVVKTFRQVVDKEKEKEDLEKSSSLDLSSLSHLPFDKATILISQITLLSDLQLAKEIEIRGKRRKSVLEAIEARKLVIGQVQ